MSTLTTYFASARGWRLIGPVLALGLLLLLALLARPATAACGGVTTVSNESQLNAAIVAYNAVNVSSCVFTIQLTGDINLTASTTVINNATSGVSLVIEGAGHTVDGQKTPGVRVFNVAANTTVTMNEITVANGFSTSGDGGGINNAGNLTLTASTVSGNFSFHGGGIANSGALNITSSTIASNNGPISGGGLYVTGGTVTVSSSTIAFNNGDGGGINQQAGTVSLSNTIVGHNTGVTGPDIRGTITSNDYNLVGDTSGGTFAPQAHDLTGVDPRLLALADNGGPTQTNALRADSPAVNAGDTALTVDQRGVSRPQLGADDMGAYEREFTVSCSGAGWSVGSQAELDEAIVCYNAKTTAGAYTITLTQNIALWSSLVAIDNTTPGVNLVIEGANFTVDGQEITGVRPFEITHDTVVEINDITIRGGNSSGLGGGILNLGQLTINDSTITDNKAASHGGGIANGIGHVGGPIAGTLTVNNSTISNNTAGTGSFTSVGGGIDSWDFSTATINNSTISGNTADEAGAIYSESNVNLSINNSTISGNTGGGRGGIVVGGTTATIDSSTITNNSGSGLIAFQNTSITVKNSIIAHQATGVDCQIAASGATLTSNGHNISSDATCGFTSTGDQQNVSAAALNLGPLADNGGSTQTHALLAGSVAIDAGDTALTTDQRGIARPQSAADDIGAYESNTLGSLTIIKNALYGDGTFNFSSQALGAFSLTTASGTAQQTFGNLAPATYDVSETVPNDWRLDSATCSDGGNPASIDIGAGETVTCTFTNQLRSYNVSATVSGGFGGTVSCTPASVTAGGSSSCTAVPDAGFRVLTWGGACAAAGSNVQCALTNIRADQVSTVSFTLIPPATYNVTATVVGGNYGSVGCYPGSVRAGDSSNCIAVAFAGFRVKSWGGACAAAGNAAQCTLTNIQADRVSTVSFELTPPDTYNVTATVVGGNGSASCYPNSVKAGESSTCIAVPKSGFRVLHWGGACAAAGSNSSCSLTKIQADQVSTVSFELTPPDTYNVTATVVGGNGSASCYPNSVKAGESSTCIAVAYAGYQVQAWSGACATAGNAAQCSLTNIQADQNSTVRFVALSVPTYTVSATVSGGNGTVSCVPSPVSQGDSSSCTATPNPGYQVAAWTGDCAASGQNVYCTLSNIQRDQSSTVSFNVIPPNNYSVTATVALGYGNVSCTPNTVVSGGSSTCTAVPEAGYQVQDWSGACAATGSQAQCNLTNIQANQTSTVSFTPLLPNTDTYTINATVTGGNGTVSCDPTRVAKGGQSTCTAVPATGYQVQAWSGDCATAGSNAQCYLPKIRKNQTSTVTFAAIPPGTVHVVALVVGGNGTVSCTPTSVSVGGNVTCIATPEAGYQVAYWDGACLLASNNPQCSLTNLQSDQQTVVAFAVSSVVTPPITDVPTLSEWGLLLLGTLLALGAWWQERIRTATGYR